MVKSNKGLLAYIKNHKVAEEDWNTPGAVEFFKTIEGIFYTPEGDYKVDVLATIKRWSESINTEDLILVTGEHEIHFTKTGAMISTWKEEIK